MPGKSYRTAGIVAAALLGAVVVVQQQIDPRVIPLQEQASVLYVSRPELVKRLSLGYDGLMACVYWTRAVQHYGRERLGVKRYHLLPDLLQITTTLDPRLLMAYRFGAVFLSQKYPYGPGRPDLAVKLLEKGIQANPDAWQLYFDLAFVHYDSFKNYAQAGAVLRKGAELPDAPYWMEALATKMEAEGSSRQTAVFLWRQLYESTDDPNLRRTALLYLQGLQADRDIEELENLVAQYKSRIGEFPKTWEEMTRAGLLAGIPVDPDGHPYVLMNDGKVLLNPESKITTAEKPRAR